MTPPSLSRVSSISRARTAAFDILLRVVRHNAYASELLYSGRHSSLSSADHRLATQIVQGVLRWRSRLDEEIAAASSRPLEKLDPEVLEALRVGTYQLVYLDRIPRHAIINESVGLVKRARKNSAAAFVNAVLRKLSKPDTRLASAAAGDQAGTLSQRFAHPPWLIDRWMAEFGEQTAARICAYNQHPPPTAIRLRDPDAAQELRDAGVKYSPGSLVSVARVVDFGDVTRTGAFEQGRVLIQDEASQLIAALLGRGRRLLDCCSAPGGKTSFLADRNPDSPILAVEVHPHRARLTRKLVRQTNVHVVCADVCQLPIVSNFDRVLVDVPCSGTGTLARNPEIKWRLKPEDLAELALRQLAILESSMRHVAPGGRLLYSSCSLEPEENRGVVARALAKSRHFKLISMREQLEGLADQGDLSWPDLDSLLEGDYLRTVPGIHPCDGFFAAVIARDE
ncbi:MAG: 16S rRNA (cytosine(967)-C(5))-methyltransferase RsmB [Acidobacteria bacterium]|nr:16S rRNA (cytosine(967)-C(5))-methyltransferase RsmB [Acidobacteriota bacterium]MBV9479149.1 16S rRNA (cytosine(967)-C(5))-methyltransferase RsmB [Acidobacteriota bacterium]